MYQNPSKGISFCTAATTTSCPTIPAACLGRGGSLVKTLYTRQQGRAEGGVTGDTALGPTSEGGPWARPWAVISGDQESEFVRSVRTPGIADLFFRD